MKKTVDVAEVIKKVKQATEQIVEQNTKKNNFICKHGYSREDCICLRKSAV
ncbi:MAG: hypothetical protein ACXVH2_09650 [Methanobacterium sp.]